MEHKSTILVVDDEPFGRDTLEALLIRQGYELAFAGNGPEALAAAADLAPDLILLDVMMPGMDGFEVCRRLRADPLLAEVPVIMVTALDDRDSRLQGIEAGADDFVTKPFDRVELRARVQTITRLNRYRRLLAERTRFEWVVDHASDGYLMVNDADEVVYANSQAYLYLDHTPSEPGQSITEGPDSPVRFLDLASREYHCEPQEAWATWPDEPDGMLQSPRYLVRPESAVANVFWLLVDVFALPAGSGAGKIVRLRDVTAEMSQQRDMRGFHEMVRHKMRTPLTSMLSGLELLTRHASKLSVDQIVELSSAALGGTRRLRSAVEDILSYLNASGLARSSTGFELVQLETLVTEVSDHLDVKSMTVPLAEGLDGLRLLLSERAVELVLWEILDNAHKFHPEHRPRVEVQVRRAGPDQVSLQIMDDGLTVSPEHLGRMWTPYYQGEKYFTGETPGMGLGLSTVAALVWEVGGTCRAFNREDGPGIVVELVLPLEKTGEQPSE